MVAQSRNSDMLAVEAENQLSTQSGKRMTQLSQ